jgi:hypothetical protein
MPRSTTIARRMVETYAARDGWETENGRVAQCQCCAETKPVRALYAVPVTEPELLAGAGPTMCVCARCKSYRKRVGK